MWRGCDGQLFFSLRRNSSPQARGKEPCSPFLWDSPNTSTIQYLAPSSSDRRGRPRQCFAALVSQPCGTSWGTEWQTHLIWSLNNKSAGFNDLIWVLTSFWGCVKRVSQILAIAAFEHGNPGSHFGIAVFEYGDFPIAVLLHGYEQKK